MNLKRSEADVKSSVQQLLKARGILCFRLNCGDQIIVQGGSRRRIMGNPSGTADLLVFCSSSKIGKSPWAKNPLWLELKSSTGKQSPEQRQFQEMVEREGHTYLICRSADQLNEWLNANT